MTTWSRPADLAIGKVTVDSTFKINGQLCVPTHGARSDILQLATRGVGFDKRLASPVYSCCYPRNHVTDPPSQILGRQVKPEKYSYVGAA